MVASLPRPVSPANCHVASFCNYCCPSSFSFWNPETAFISGQFTTSSALGPCNWYWRQIWCEIARCEGTLRALRDTSVLLAWTTMPNFIFNLQVFEPDVSSLGYVIARWYFEADSNLDSSLSPSLLLPLDWFICLWNMANVGNYYLLVPHTARFMCAINNNNNKSNKSNKEYQPQFVPRPRYPLPFLAWNCNENNERVTIKRSWKLAHTLPLSLSLAISLVSDAV